MFKTRHFARWMRKSALTDDALCWAVREMTAGLVDADLGGGVVKKRIALPGRGKRGSVRTLVVTRSGNLWFFVFGFEKADRAGISTAELSALKELGASLLGLSTNELNVAVAEGALQEICCGYKVQEQEPYPQSGRRNDRRSAASRLHRQEEAARR